ncbi:Nramp family divalent metal transporter [Nakamurella flavida]|uniref:Nramp family divalent metal transporter n=1 Tax=Nakamurella flavida TaxID=363630 RepID=A0A939C2R6_9ACTN|nr:Nramp family divalent metal transporter [Nakamurella flavida]MBM9476865.1 Nramp family divalent metal transporter [Nakamurella flavida]MDP9779809.1 manganese transport protein [Nakamurella flavida]
MSTGESSADLVSPGVQGGRSRRRRWVTASSLGPAFVAAVAYVDPGNVAANLQAGARYGYLLVWVLVLATASAGIVQFLSAKLGLTTGASLPELVGRRTRRSGRLAYWLQAEAVAMATDLAEVVGGAIALYLLFDLPLLLGGLVAGAVSLFLLLVQDRRGQRPFERVITGLLLVIAIGFVAGLFVAPPSPSGVVGGLVPRFDGLDSVLLATAMLGATVMPHVVYLHSALTRDRFGVVPPGPERRRLLSATRVDVGIAMVLAGAVNISMLLLAASALRGVDGVDTIEGAHAAVTAGLGPVIGLMFAIGLLASGLASASVGSYAGSVIMDGLIHKRIPVVWRRVITLIPALIVLGSGVDPTSALIISQVVLSFGLPFVLVPLLRLTADRDLMGEQVNGRVTQVAGWAITAAIVGLNGVLIVGVVTGG